MCNNGMKRPISPSAGDVKFSQTQYIPQGKKKNNLAEHQSDYWILSQIQKVVNRSIFCDIIFQLLGVNCEKVYLLTRNVNYVH